MVWFKHDLRLDDHPGLQAALELGAPLLPVYCFDPEQYAHLLQLPGGVAGAGRGGPCRTRRGRGLQGLQRTRGSLPGAGHFASWQVAA